MLIRPDAVKDTLKKDGEFLNKLSKKLNLRIKYLNDDGEKKGPDAKLILANEFYIELKRRTTGSLISDACSGRKKFPFKTLQFPGSNLYEAVRNDREDKTFFIQYDDLMEGYFEVLGSDLCRYGKKTSYVDPVSHTKVNAIEIDMKYVMINSFRRY